MGMDDIKIQISGYLDLDFSLYGKILSVEKRAPEAEGKDFSFWGSVGEIMCDKTSIGVVRSYPQRELLCPSLEKHDNSTETLIPVEGDIILVIALSNTDNPEMVDKDTIRAVRVKQGDAITLLPSVWHYAPMVLDREVYTFVLFEEDTLKNDLTQEKYTEKTRIHLEVPE